MKNLLKILLMMLFTTLANAELKSNKKVFISQFVRHPALDVTTKGIIDGLTKEGYIKDLNLKVIVEYGQAKPVLSQAIATKFVNKNPDVVVGVATLAAQSFLKYARENKVKLIFSAWQKMFKFDLKLIN